MLKMIIADDEQLIRQSLYELIDWKSLGIEIVGCCRNGMEALDAAIDESPDIIMTDIKMPGLTGLELIQKLKQLDQDIQFIILSGYQEFEFAKQAMQYGVKLYLLKPISEQQIFEAVETAKRDCLKLKSINQIKEQSQHSYQKMLEAYRRQFIYELFSPNNDCHETIERYHDYFKQQCDYQIYYFSFLEENFLNPFSKKFYDFCERHKLMPIFDLFYVKNSAVAVFPKTISNQHELFSQFSKAISFSGQCTELSYQFQNFSNFSECIIQMHQKLARYHKILMIDRLQEIREIYNYVSLMLNLESVSKQLFQLAKEKNKDGVLELLNIHFDPLHSPQAIRNFGATLISNLLNKTKQNSCVTGIFDDLYQEHEPEELKEILKKSILTLLFPDSNDVCPIDKVKAYLQDHLDDPELSLKQIAEHHLFMNVDYLSRQFVTETGEKFSAYLNRTRVERAKTLLLRYDSDKIYTVAEQVGFGNNPRYFSQIFKKFTGMTPSKYVESVKQQGENL